MAFRPSYLSHQLFLAVLIVSIIAISPAMAAVTLSGVIYRADITPGTTIVFPMTLSSGASDSPADYDITVIGFGNSPNGNYIGIDPAQDTSTYSARPFITLNAATVHIPPGGNVVVNATIRVPATGSGGRYALINFHARQVLATGAGSGMTTAINVPVMITLKGTQITETGAIKSVTVDTIVPEKPVSVITSFSNTGNHHYYGASNQIAVTDITGKELARVAGTPLVSAIVPGGNVNFTQQIAADLSPGTYTVASKVLNSNGTVLDTKTTTFTVSDAHAAPALTASATQPGSPAPAGVTAKPGVKTTYSPPGIPTVLLAITVIAGIFGMRRKI